jgi:hypothetical protein
MIFPPDELPDEELYPYVTLPPALGLVRNEGTQLSRGKWFPIILF